MKVLLKTRVPFNKIVLFGFWPGFLKKQYLKFRGNKIGRGVKIGFGSIVSSKNIKLGDKVKIAPFCVIQSETVNIGNNVSIGSFSFFDLIKLEIGDDSRIRESVWVGGNKTSQSSLSIGQKCLVLQNTVLNTTDKIKIGDNTAIGGGSRLFTHSSWLSALDGYPVIQGPINIGSNVWIPYDTTILANVTIGEHVIITPRSVVSQNIPAKSIAGGEPLKITNNFYYRKLNIQKKNAILSKVADDMISILKNEGFKNIDNAANLTILSKKSQNIVICKDKNAPEKLALDFNFNYNKKEAACFYAFINDKNYIANPGMPAVLIIDDKPLAINTNELTDMILIFLSRYGIR